VVVGARTAVVIEEAAAILAKKGKTLTTKDIDAILKEQIAQVKAARSEIGISAAQQANLEKVLYRYSGVVK
jgi:ribosomal protein L12E/L44/L45/RPP1/RPP2